MPGLAGLVGVRGTEEQRQAILASMLSSLQSEPCQVPSGRVVGPAALGRVSLEIFNPGPQPVSDPTGPRWALLEGELYNLPPLDGHHDLDETRAKHTSQAEHLLRLREAAEAKFADKLAGIPRG